MSTSDEERAYDQRIAADVAEHGCHIALLPGGGGRSGCAFTVGLWRSHRHPELVVFGLDGAQAEDLLDLLQEEIEQGNPCAAGASRAGILHQYPVAFRAVTADRVAWFEPAVRFHGGADFPMLQVFWPDRQGRFPWDEGAQEACRRGQPRLDQQPA